ncbi:ABC transporter ATP-binding protein [Neorhizobium galegae]|uniref:Glutathione import ATP-binding protein GsiA n=1 Tax=Neorhizobium galegae bv. orientalis str. HAMBI 540 TaxID=1028800 RepID=A0A068T0S1_NEOGA|nr:ABC transporter ATP-binding protein [Neorhizobium galegae]MCQ1853376.1 ABC transporter ATP-binding protein [Neorhizobium galegae]CDN51988.1 Dipeptide ABC transporter, ATP-binding protein [Neorhizobium galegae bv. orientalis str. HAMBI 540]CDZ53097.1 Dipeptide ABC transporter, ATP-binding protein [Neorhizobium galegae bv. orientalis]
MIEIRDLKLSFGTANNRVHPLGGLSFSVQKGETYGIVGESGCGKSSLLRCVAGLERGWTGSINIAGKRAPRVRHGVDCRTVQMVFQDPYGTLHPRHTIGMALSEPLRAQGMERSKSRIADALRTVGLNPAFAERFPHQLSGGQRQRVAIARALILQPDVVLLDEPTSALDVSVQAEILNLLADLSDDRGLTYLLVSHDLAVVAHMCSRIAVMQSGKILEELNATDLRRGNVSEPYTRELIESSKLRLAA